jgi:phenylacetate-coenzyme A ligase PaaK-like adenylate-forming protein
MSCDAFVFGKKVTFAGALTDHNISAIIAEGRKVHADASLRPTEADTWNLLDALSKAWSDPEFEPRRKAIEILPKVTGFSPEMVRMGLTVLARDLLAPAALQKKISTELQGIPGPLGSGFRYDPSNGTALQWRPLGVVLHVLAGNVFLGSVGSLLEGLLTGNVSILKMSSDESVFLPLFLESLAALDERGLFCRRIAAISFPSSATEVVGAFKHESDAIVVWGGEQAVRGWRDGLPASCRLIVFGPKYSLAVVTAAGMKEHSASETARRIASELAIWDQNACTAPQVCYVEGKDNARELVKELGLALAAQEAALPAGAVDFQTASEIRKTRGLQEVRQALGVGALAASAFGLQYTAYIDESLEPEASPLHRTLRIVPFDRLDDVCQAIRPISPQLQTLGLLTGVEEELATRETLADLGVLRLLPLGKMAGGEADDPHDGAYDLPQLLKLVCHRFEDKWRFVHPEDRVDPGARNVDIEQRLGLLDRAARQTSFYAKRLEKCGKLTLESLAAFPRLTRHDLEENTPPFGSGLLAPDNDAPQDARFALQGGYVTRSGGSTGDPKYSLYDGQDWKAMMDHGVRVFLGAGLRKGDRLANCFLAGDLYGSFVSFDHINVRLGVTTFAFGAAVTGEGILKAWRAFNLNAIMGVPAIIVPALRRAHAIDPSFRTEKVVFAGQPMSKADATWLREVLGAKRVSSIIGANDGGQIGYQCEHLEGAAHHAVDEYNLLEFTDEDGKLVPEGEPGHILVTTLRKTRLPLIRYAIGDKGRVLGHGCPCGRTGRIFEYLGRSDDTINVGLMNLPMGAVRSVVESDKETGVTEMQFIVRADSKGEAILLRIESSVAIEARHDGHDLAARIKENVLSSLPIIANRLAEGALASFHVEVGPPGFIPRNERTGKIRGAIDER